jgi:antitoxin component YwqK of YwqJK toxin-antitoxin module
VYRDTQLTLKPTVKGKNCAIPSLYLDYFTGLTGQVPGRYLRRVTFTHHIAVPLAATYKNPLLEMKQYLFLFIMFGALFGCARDNYFDKNRRNEHWAWWADANSGKSKWLPITNESSTLDKGEYTLFYFNGNIREIGKLDKGKNVDTVFRYNLVGKLVSYKIVLDRLWYYVEDGDIKLYFENGRIWEEGIVHNHRYGDKWTQYFRNGNIKYINNFVNDTGWIVNFYESGKLKDSVYHVSGLDDFTIKSWFDNGNLELSTGFIGNNFNGITKHYYENGQLKDSGSLINGKWAGIQFEWYDDGHLKAKNIYKNGKLDGEQHTYHQNGKPKTIGIVKNGVLSGEVRQYDEKGKLIIDEYYENGIKVKIDSSINKK